jgi:hypothetical protein
VPESLAVPDPTLHELVEQAHVEGGIRTIVVAVDPDAGPDLEPGTDALPGFDPEPALHELALAGGAPTFVDGEPTYFRADDPEALLFALDPFNQDGWTWIPGEEGVLVTFCGQACEDFKNGGASFDGDYGCPDQ